MVTTVLAVLFFKERVTVPRIIGICISLIGVFSVVTNLDLEVISGMRLNQGDIFMSLGVLCFAIYMLLSRRFMMKYEISPLSTTAYTFLICTVLSFILSYLLENPAEEFLRAQSGVWIEILYMSIFASVIGYYIQLRSISAIGAPRTAMFINLVPVSTILLASVILGEEVTTLKVICAILIIFGVYLATRPERLNAYPI